MDERPVARMNWTLYVDCPKCSATMDVVDYDADHDNLISMLIFNNKWDKVPGHDLTCPSCGHEFEIGHITY